MKRFFSFEKKKLLQPGSIFAKKHKEEESAKQKEDEAKRIAQAAADRDKLLTKSKEEPELLVRPKKAKRKRKTLKELLIVAGINREPQAIYKGIFLTAIFLTFALTAVSLFIEFTYDNTFHTLASIGSYIGFLAALWTVVFLAILAICALGFAAYLDFRINKRQREIEAVFPDYLQLAAANLSAGMTIDRALWSAIRPRFGVLAKEIEDVAKKTMTGYDLEIALQEFGAKYDSPPIQRSVNLIVEGIHSGGHLADILNKIAINMQENAILQKEMAANVTTYTIFISFATIIAAPFLFGLSTQLLIVIKTIAGSIGSDSSGVGLSINANAVKESDFRIYAIVMLTLSSIMSASIVSVIRKGTIKDGVRLIPFFWVITVGLYFLSTWMLGFMFGGLI
jgi:pilus assembly protein TadC